MREILEELRRDDDEMLLMESERLALKEDLHICEADFAVWASVYESRIKEKGDIQQGIKMMLDLQKLRQNERDTLRSELDLSRRDLPACIGLLSNFTEASKVAATLNSTLESAFTALSPADTALAIAQTAGNIYFIFNFNFVILYQTGCNDCLYFS